MLRIFALIGFFVVNGIVCEDSRIKPKGLLDTQRINVAFTFTKAEQNRHLQLNLRQCASSLLQHATIDLNIFIIGDTKSQLIARQIFAELKSPFNINFEVLSLDSELMAKKMHEIVSKMQQHFSHSPSSYYGDSLFFLSIGIHQILDLDIRRLIMLDVDLKFANDIRNLWSQFDEFKDTNLIGIARDAQPVYRHVFWQYRSENPDTRVGSPPPDGLTGFNSGVLLLDLERMRQSSLYQQLITPESIEKLTKKFYFKGHLGDQDFFSIVSMEHDELFYILPCSWNRQLCQWWKEHGYADVFDEYFRCNEKRINIWHGNCNTPIPDLTQHNEL